ncbi:tRNA-queuosine alpha-mannosyltransferase-like isoform X2 [Littorina saxatilis]|uniref:tRNA-queuosine alpha-mannosyltransferase n=1 Tax=Littorina saxatilis TaxID=31220 RepID=A0AAN9GKX2_9CAEN
MTSTNATTTSKSVVQDILLLEPFYCGSHKQLIDGLMKDMAIAPRAHLVTMSGKKWHWRARVSALHLSTAIPVNHNFRVLFSSSVLNLVELVALRPDLASLHKVLYFHENQLQYPVRKQKDRDFQYGYNLILSCLVADCVLFNSSFNMESFLTSITSFLKLMPDYRPKGLADVIRPKCSVLYFPMLYQNIDLCLLGEEDGCTPKKAKQLGQLAEPSHRQSVQDNHVSQELEFQHCRQTDTCDSTQVQDRVSDGSHSLDFQTGSGHYPKLQADQVDPDAFDESAMEVLQTHSSDDSKQQAGHGDSSDSVRHGPFVAPSAKLQSNSIHIVWPHRWEHDKDPETFFQALFRLHEEGLSFVVSVLGETFTEVPDIFAEAQDKLRTHIFAWGYQAKKSDYYKVLKAADVVVSTSKHEFFGVAMLEAVYLDCYPLCPKTLVYPEIYPDECLYSTSAKLYKRLRDFCRHPHLARASSLKGKILQFSWENLREEYFSKLQMH